MFNPGDLISVFSLKRARVIKDNIMSQCPFASQNHVGGTDNRRSFGINIISSQWNCFTCGARGNNIRSLAFRLGILLPNELMIQTIEFGNSTLSDRVEEQRRFLPISVLDNFNFPELAYGKLGYRGISIAAIKRFKVGFNKSTGAVVFPCVCAHDKNKLDGWIERNEQWENRYAFCPEGTQRRYCLFGLDRKIKRCYLVEGATDALKLISWFYEAVSTCGNMIFQEQALELISNCEEIVLVRDCDKGGDRWLSDAEKYLRGFVKLYLLEPNYQRFKDVGHQDYLKEEFEKCNLKIL